MDKSKQDKMIAALIIFVASFAGLMIGLTLMAGSHLYELGHKLEGIIVMCMPSMTLVLLMATDYIIDWVYARGFIKKIREEKV